MLENAEKEQWHVTIAEKDVALAESKIKGNKQAKAVPFDVFDAELLTNLVNENDLVISMLPASLHIHVARKCAEFKNIS